jgi:hypothetical protein
LRDGIWCGSDRGLVLVRVVVPVPARAQGEHLSSNVRGGHCKQKLRVAVLKRRLYRFFGKRRRQQSRRDRASVVVLDFEQYTRDQFLSG